MIKAYIPRFLYDELIGKISLLRDPSCNELVFKEGLGEVAKLICQKISKKELLSSARLQSYRIEHPGSVVFPYSLPKKTRNVKEGLKDLKRAFLWGKENFNGEIDENFIRELAFKTTPSVHPHGIGIYRNVGVRITGATTTPPDPYKVREIEMPKFVEELNELLKNDSPEGRIYSALWSHLHLVRIHPFEDGNGRTSRMLQDIILDSSNLPVPVVNSGERATYYSCLDKAVYQFKHEKLSGDKPLTFATDGEKGFYTFMGGKLNVSLDQVVDGCKKLFFRGKN